eukprot:GHVO01043657.1.p1 GENE.GHVO01043657.1~~GHVO01043657.1.p1  ORF type:complete len:179 (+),score=15.23 GHVO01043657.1:259-795(+)
MIKDRNRQKSSPLHCAVEKGAYKVVDIILARGEIQSQIIMGCSLLIFTGADVNESLSSYNTPLHLAAMSGHCHIVELLLDQNARIRALNRNGSTPLHKAAAYNQADVVKFLLERGAKSEIFDKNHFTPLSVAAKNGHAESIKTLLDHGANLYAVDKKKRTTLYHAAKEDHIKALRVSA